jgi:hypothetical protein
LHRSIKADTTFRQEPKDLRPFGNGCLDLVLGDHVRTRKEGEALPMYVIDIQSRKDLPEGATEGVAEGAGWHRTQPVWRSHLLSGPYYG